MGKNKYRTSEVDIKGEEQREETYKLNKTWRKKKCKSFMVFSAADDFTVINLLVYRFS